MTSSGGRERLQRFGAVQDGVAWALAGLAVLLSAVFIGLSYFYYNFNNLVPPLDDVYIHLQYARQLGQGQPFHYQDGDPVTTGASSLLYVLILGAAYAVGFTGPFLLAFATAFGVACFAATVVLVYALGRRLGGRAVGAWAGLLVAVNGALLWGATSGMEVGLVALLVTGAVYVFVREAPGGRFLLTPVVAALAALARPEGLIFAVGLCATMGWVLAVRVRRGAVRARAGAARGVWALLPVAAGAGQLLFYLVATGTTTANGVAAKSFLYRPILYPTQFLADTVTNFGDFLALLSGLSTQQYVFPAALVFFLLGAVYLAVEQPRRRPLALAVTLGFFVVLLAISSLLTALWQNVRYAQPFLPLFLLFAVLGIVGVSRLAGPERSGRLVAGGLLATALVFTLAALPTWALRLGQQAATIREGPVSIAHWLRGNIPDGAVIAVNDVGATAYFSRHQIVDLIGLTTNGFAQVTRNGVGTLYEKLAQLPPEQRPDYFSIYEGWPGPPIYRLRKAGVLGEKPVMTFELKFPAHQVGPPPPPCQSNRTCTVVSVFEADWSRAGRAELPVEPMPGIIRDRVDVGDLASERAHDYQVHPVQVGIQPLSMLRTVRTRDGTRVVDSGRRVIGGESFVVHNLIPGRPLTIQARTDPNSTLDDPRRPTSLRVLVNGQPVGVWQLPRVRTGWEESAFTIPGRLVTGPRLEIELAPRSPAMSPYPDYHSFGYWFRQPSRRATP